MLTRGDYLRRVDVDQRRVAVTAIRRTFRNLLTDQRGATAIEYGLIAALIIIAMMGGLSTLGGGANGMWGRIASNVDASM